ncbi:hypothetical protein evm_015345 [Chilo suppressalis]|nr:hypothetical protein evm_015345 [Chilo suppressalis]
MNACDAMLQRYRTHQSRDSRRGSATRRVATEVSDDADAATDDAYDVTHYFADDFADPWREGDALERERLTQHGRLRELVSRGDVVQLKAALAALGSNADLVVNLTPGAANTLLYT